MSKAARPRSGRRWISLIAIFSCTNHRPSHPPSAVGVRSIVNRPSSPAISSRPSRIVQYRSQPAPPEVNLPSPRSTIGLWVVTTTVVLEPPTSHRCDRGTIGVPDGVISGEIASAHRSDRPRPLPPQPGRDRGAYLATVWPTAVARSGETHPSKKEDVPSAHRSRPPEQQTAIRRVGVVKSV